MSCKILFQDNYDYSAHIYLFNASCLNDFFQLGNFGKFLSLFFCNPQSAHHNNMQFINKYISDDAAKAHVSIAVVSSPDKFLLKLNSTEY